MEGHYLNISESLSLLEMQEKEFMSTMDIPSLLKRHMMSLKFGLRFLKTFLQYSNNEALKRRIRSVVYHVWEELDSLSKRPKNVNLIRYFGTGYYSLCVKMKNVIIEPQTREYDVIFQQVFENLRYFKKINDFLVDISWDLLSCNVNQVAEEIEDINEKLTFLIPLLTYVANKKVHVVEEKIKLLTPLVDALDRAACLFFSCLFEKMNEETDLEMKCRLSDLHRKFNVKEIYVVVLKASHISKSKDNPLDSDFYLLENHIWLLDCNIYLNDQSRNLHEELKTLRNFLVGLPYEEKIKRLNYLVVSIGAITSMAIPILSSCCVRNMKANMVRHVDGALSEVLDQTRYMQDAVCHPKIDGRGFEDEKIMDFEKEEIVGFDVDANKIMEHLCGEDKKLDVVSITGMPGCGKTTLAKKIFRNRTIRNHFEVKAWCCVSQKYHKREVLLSLLEYYTYVTDISKTMSDEGLTTMLNQILRGRTYLIVIDDIWDIEVWMDLERIFPNDNNCSRILITSRLRSVAYDINTSVHTLHHLSDDDSFELFKKKLYPEEMNSHDFLEVGKKIVYSCKGLPLAIVSVARILATMQKNLHIWEQIAENVISYIVSDSQSYCMAMLNCSYNQLSDELRSCFLYIGALLDDKEFPAWKLKVLWICNGFVRDSDNKNLEDLSEEYLMDLISRGFLIVTKKRSQGGIKSIRVHDIWRAFCLEKAKEENLSKSIQVGDGSKFLRVYGIHGLGIYCVVDSLLKAKPSGCSISLLLHTATTDIPDLKLLRVMDLACINIRDLFSGIDVLCHLRYLAFTIETNAIPSSITNLWNLQFLLIKTISHCVSEVVDVPDSLWDMVNLRHVRIYHCASFELKKSRLRNSSLMEKLETLSTPCLSYGEDAENLLRRLPNLRKLSCIFLDYLDDDDEDSCKYPLLEFLDQLLTLKVNFYMSKKKPQKCVFNFPSTLQKLTILNFEIPLDNISMIGRELPNLRVLKLIGGGSNGTWVTDEGDFPNLRYLKLKYVMLDEWSASDDTFPTIEQLVLEDCNNLDEIPSCFGGMVSLRMLTVRNCRPSVRDSAREIKEQQEEWQNEELKIYIYPNE